MDARTYGEFTCPCGHTEDRHNDDPCTSCNSTEQPPRKVKEMDPINVHPTSESLEVAAARFTHVFVGNDLLIMDNHRNRQVGTVDGEYGAYVLVALNTYSNLIGDLPL